MRRSYHKTICLDFENEANYQACLQNGKRFKSYLNELWHQHRELFPEEMQHGWRLCGYTPVSKKQDYR